MASNTQENEAFDTQPGYSLRHYSQRRLPNRYNDGYTPPEHETNLPSAITDTDSSLTVPRAQLAPIFAVQRSLRASSLAITAESDPFDYDKGHESLIDPSLRSQSIAPSEPEVLSNASTSTAPKPDKRLRSWIWQHSLDLSVDGPQSRRKSTNLDRIWTCMYCKKQMRPLNGTGFIKNHLLRHQKTEEKPVVRNTLGQAMRRAEEIEQQGLSQECYNAQLIHQVLQQLYTAWVVESNISFNMVEHQEVRDFLLAVNPAVESWLPRSHNTVASWIERQHIIEKARIQQSLQSAISKIHATVAIWTSPNTLAILGIYAHYISKDGQYYNIPLSFLEIERSYTSEHLANTVMDVFEGFRIVSKLGYFVMDNATNNDTMMEALEKLE